MLLLLLLLQEEMGQPLLLLLLLLLAWVADRYSLARSFEIRLADEGAVLLLYHGESVCACANGCEKGREGGVLAEPSISRLRPRLLARWAKGTGICTTHAGQAARAYKRPSDKGQGNAGGACVWGELVLSWVSEEEKRRRGGGGHVLPHFDAP